MGESHDVLDLKNNFERSGLLGGEWKLPKDFDGYPDSPLSIGMHWPGLGKEHFYEKNIGESGKKMRKENDRRKSKN